METLRRCIEEHVFFKSLKPEQIEVIVGCASNQRAPVRSFLFKEGEPANQFYLLREGQVALESHIPYQGQIVIETVEAGDVLGWSWLVPPRKWHFDAKVTSALRYLAFDADCLLRKMDADPSLGYALMKLFVPVMVQRLQSTRLRLMDLYACPRSEIGV